MNIMFKTTSSCNANCIYCFDKVSQDNKRQLMSLEQLQDIFNHLCDLTNHINWCWHGGEPTLAGIEWMDQAMFSMKKIAMSKKVFLSFSIQTNGILLDQSWFDLFDKYQVNLGMSYDGINSLKSRGYVSQADQHTLMSYASLIYILNPFNIKNLLNDYKAINASGCQSCAINWVFPHDGDTAEHIWGGDLETPIQKYLEYLDYYIWDMNGQVYDRNAVDWVLESLGKIVDVCIFGNCWASEMFCIDYKGQIYKCDEIEREEVRLGNLLDFKTFDELMNHPKILKQKELHEKWKMTDCRNCIYQQSCMQGCHTRSISESKGQHPYSFHCLLTKKIIPHLYQQLSDLTPEQFVQLNPIIQQALIREKYIPSSIKEKCICQQ